jgi:hypothetical protein
MTNKYFRFKILSLLFIILILTGCSDFNRVSREVRNKDSFQKIGYENNGELEKDSPYLKIHMKDGSVYVLHNWQYNDSSTIGKGCFLNEYRDTLSKGNFNVSNDSVSLFETNEIESSGSQVALTIFTGITAAVTIACIANPKACFGSCPTFYVEDSDGYHLRAEGFSSSIIPSMETSDIDALYREGEPGKDFFLEMKNEALETHVVRSADLIAVPKKKGSRVFADNKGNFWESKTQESPVLAESEEGDALKLLKSFDEKEWFSKADSNYLGTKEILNLEFDNANQQPCGLVIGCRQTLLSTYLLYQTFAYMGNDIGYWMSQIEKHKLMLNKNSMAEIMGGIEILTQDSTGKWKVNGVINEQGPLAVEVHFIPLDLTKKKNLKIRLRMTKGNWRIDYAALALNVKKAEPILIKPRAVLKKGAKDKNALDKLCDSTKSLITLPGDIYTLNYKIPTTYDSYELFLKSRGYYLEWVRKEWIKEENSDYLWQIFLEPKAALSRLAPEFKSVESSMEKSFWRSRYAKP